MTYPALTPHDGLAIALASVANFVLGGVWFGVLFPRRYRVVLGIADRPPQRPGALFLAGPFACGLVSVATTAVLMRALHVATLGDALALGALVGVGLQLATTLNIAINPLFPRPFAYTLLNAPFFVGGSLMACAILQAVGG